MKTRRKRYSAEFKAKVSMEAIRGDLTLVAKHRIHHTMIGAWKRQAMNGIFGGSLRSMSVSWRRSKIEPAHQHLSIAMQCRLLSISRSSYYYTPVPETEETLALMTVIDQTFMECPWYGSRQMARHLRRLGHAIGRRRVRD